MWEQLFEERGPVVLIAQLNKIGMTKIAVAISSSLLLSACTSTKLASIAKDKDGLEQSAAASDIENAEVQSETIAEIDQTTEATQTVKPLALASTRSESLFPDRPGTPAVAVSIKTRSETPPPEIDKLIKKYSRIYGVPEKLVHHVAHRESTYNPTAFSKGNYGLMQIRYRTAKGMGYDGKPEGLFDAETNLKYAVKYLRNAWVVADKDEKAADWLYRTGYYYEAKRKGKLAELNLMNSNGLH